MPTINSYGEVLELWRYGLFTKGTFFFQIPKEYAVTFPAILDTPIHNIPPAVQIRYEIREDYIGIMDKFDFGDTSRPAKVYIEWYIGGHPYPAGVTQMFAPEFSSGYKGGTYITKSASESLLPYITGEFATFKFWNTTGIAPEDVYFEATIFYYTFQRKYYKEVYNILMRDWVLLQEILNLLRLQIALTASPDVGRLVAEKLGVDKVDGELAELIVKTIEKAKKPYREEVVVEYG